MHGMKTSLWLQCTASMAFFLAVGCVAQRDDLEPSERQALAENIEAGNGVGEVSEAAWPAAGKTFKVNLEASLTCAGLLQKSQAMLARAWISAIDEESPIPVLAPRGLDLQISVLNGLFEGMVLAKSRSVEGHRVEAVHALDGNALSNPCGCVVVAATATGFSGSLKSTNVSKRVICPEAMTYQPPGAPE